MTHPVTEKVEAMDKNSACFPRQMLWSVLWPSFHLSLLEAEKHMLPLSKTSLPLCPGPLLPLLPPRGPPWLSLQHLQPLLSQPVQSAGRCVQVSLLSKD